MNILSLDLGTTSGWAIYKPGLPINHGTVVCKSGRFEGGGMQYVRFIHWLDDMHQVYEIQQVVFEEVRAHTGTTAAHVYGGFMGHLTSWCELKKIPYEGIPVGTIKKFIAGKGNAGKQAVIDAIRAKGYNPSNDNDADALALLLFKLSEVNHAI